MPVPKTYLEMTPEEFLNDVINSRRLSQNEIARNAGISESGVTRFRQGKAGAEVCISLAGYLRVPVEVLLSMQGLWTYPSTRDEQSEEILSIYRLGSDETRAKLLDYARYLSFTER